MSFSSFSSFFKKKVLFLTHSGCDIDALASAAAIYFSLSKKIKITIGIPDHMNLQANKLAKNLEIPFAINPQFSGFDAVVCLDFNESAMLGSMREKFLEFRGVKYLIDHHRSGKEKITRANNTCSRKDAISTTEIVHDMLKATKVKIPKKAYECIAAGIISDSASFTIADHETFYIMAEVMQKANAPYSTILSRFSVGRDFSEKVACLKAAKRCRIFRSGETVIAISDIGAFEASAAGALVRAGADVAICGYSEKGEIRISGRVNNYWMRENGFDLARDCFVRLGSFFDGNGGGHPGAAGFNGKGNSVEAHLLKCVDLVHDFGVRKNNLTGPVKEYT